MQKFLIFALMAVACTSMLLVSGHRGEHREGRNKDKISHHSKESHNLRECQWSFEPCVLNGGANGGAVCGKGQKLGKSLNESCPVKEKQFKCKVPCGCQYKAVKNTDAQCSPGTRKEITEVLITGDASKCAETRTVFKNCHRRGAREAKAIRKGGKPRTTTTTVAPEAVDEQEESVAAVAPAGKGACKYQRKGQKGECDPETKKMVVTMQLKKKSPATCEPTKTVSKPCKEKVKRPNRKNPKQI